RAVDEPERGLFESGNDEAIALPGIFAQFLDALGQLHGSAQLHRFETGGVDKKDFAHRVESTRFSGWSRCVLARREAGKIRNSPSWISSTSCRNDFRHR